MAPRSPQAETSTKFSPVQLFLSPPDQPQFRLGRISDSEPPPPVSAATFTREPNQNVGQTRVRPHGGASGVVAWRDVAVASGDRTRGCPSDVRSLWLSLPRPLRCICIPPLCAVGGGWRSLVGGEEQWMNAAQISSMFKTTRSMSGPSQRRTHQTQTQDQEQDRNTETKKRDSPRTEN